MSEKTVLRKAPRAVLKQPVTINDETALMMNASVTGARFRIKTDGFALDQKLTAVWPLLHGGTKIELTGTCVWLGDEEIGLRFDHLSSRALKLIEAMVRFHRSQ